MCVHTKTDSHIASQTQTMKIILPASVFSFAIECFAEAKHSARGASRLAQLSLIMRNFKLKNWILFRSGFNILPFIFCDLEQFCAVYIFQYVCTICWRDMNNLLSFVLIHKFRQFVQVNLRNQSIHELTGVKLQSIHELTKILGNS